MLDESYIEVPFECHQVRACPQCGSLVTEDHDKCQQCGKKMPEAKIPTPRPLENIDDLPIDGFASGEVNFPDTIASTHLEDPYPKELPPPPTYEQVHGEPYVNILQKAADEGVQQIAPDATISLVLGIAGVATFFFLGIVLGPFAYDYGRVALKKINEDPRLIGKKRAIAGLVLGIIDIVGYSLFLILYLSTGPKYDLVLWLYWDCLPWMLSHFF